MSHGSLRVSDRMVVLLMRRIGVFGTLIALRSSRLLVRFRWGHLLVIDLERVAQGCDYVLGGVEIDEWLFLF